MNTYIISSKSYEDSAIETEKILDGENVNKFDRTFQEFEKDLGIADVRSIQKKIYLKPLKGERKADILILKKGATIEAQNALLKLFEEPPPSSIIIVQTTNYHLFLPTIQSRAKIIEINNTTKHETDGYTQINSIEGIGDGLALAQILSKDKSAAIKWLENAILANREAMLDNAENLDEAKRIQERIEKLEQTYLDLKNTNANTRLTLENLFLDI